MQNLLELAISKHVEHHVRSDYIFTWIIRIRAETFEWYCNDRIFEYCAIRFSTTFFFLLPLLLLQTGYVV